MRRRRHAGAAVAAFALLVACSSGPAPVQWQLNAKVALDRAVRAHLEGDARVEAIEFDRARAEIARTGRVDLAARAELVRCAARMASLMFGPCVGFENMKVDAAAPERAYAAFLAGSIPMEDLPLLPPQYRAIGSARMNEDEALKTVQETPDPLSRLISAGVLFQAGRANPGLMELAVETASSQGWRRPLLAWLQVQALRAEHAGQTSEIQRLRRRMELVQGTK